MIKRTLKPIKQATGAESVSQWPGGGPAWRAHDLPGTWTLLCPGPGFGHHPPSKKPPGSHCNF